MLPISTRTTSKNIDEIYFQKEFLGKPVKFKKDFGPIVLDYSFVPFPFLFKKCSNLSCDARYAKDIKKC